MHGVRPASASRNQGFGLFILNFYFAPEEVVSFIAILQLCKQPSNDFISARIRVVHRDRNGWPKGGILG